jgi:hypothetical protein
MKIFFLIPIFSMAFAMHVNAQTPAEQLAEKIAGKMKDSLSLTETQKRQLYNINLQISSNKLAVRQQFSSPDSLRIMTQQAENMRDSLYRQVLTEQQFTTYRQKKRNLVNNN